LLETPCGHRRSQRTTLHVHPTAVPRYSERASRLMPANLFSRTKRASQNRRQRCSRWLSMTSCRPLCPAGGKLQPGSRRPPHLVQQSESSMLPRGSKHYPFRGQIPSESKTLNTERSCPPQSSRKVPSSSCTRLEQILRREDRNRLRAPLLAVSRTDYSFDTETRDALPQQMQSNCLPDPDLSLAPNLPRGSMTSATLAAHPAGRRPGRDDPGRLEPRPNGESRQHHSPCSRHRAARNLTAT